MFPRPHCVCVRVLCARTRCSVSVSVGGRTFFCCSDSERESSERHSLKTRNSDRVCVGVIHRRSVRRTPHSSLSVCVCLGPARFVFSSPQKKKTAARVFFSAAAAGERERASEVQLHYGCVCLIRQVLVRLPIDWFESSGWFEPMLMFYRLNWRRMLLIRTTYENVFVCQSNDYLIHVGGAAVGLINLPVNFLIN